MRSEINADISIIAQRLLYNRLIFSAGKSSAVRLVTIHSKESSEIGQQTTRKASWQVSEEPYSMKSKEVAASTKRRYEPSGIGMDFLCERVRVTFTVTSKESESG